MSLGNLSTERPIATPDTVPVKTLDTHGFPQILSQSISSGEKVIDRSPLGDVLVVKSNQPEETNGGSASINDESFTYSLIENGSDGSFPVIHFEHFENQEGGSGMDADSDDHEHNHSAEVHADVGSEQERPVVLSIFSKAPSESGGQVVKGSSKSQTQATVPPTNKALVSQNSLSEPQTSRSSIRSLLASIMRSFIRSGSSPADVLNMQKSDIFRRQELEDKRIEAAGLEEGRIKAFL